MSEEAEELISGVKGKLGELKGLGELLRFGYSVYTPIVDTGIDCLVDVGRGNYKEVQVKYREDHGLFQVKDFQPRDSFYIMCYLSTRYGENYWVIPSKIFAQMASRSKGFMRLQIGKEGSESYEALRNYRENLHQLLAGAPKGTRQTVTSVRERIKGPYFTQKDFERFICAQLSITRAPKTRKQITEAVFNQYLQGKLSAADQQNIKSGQPRWRSTADWAISNLKRRGMIKDVAKNQYVLTEKGLRAINRALWIPSDIPAKRPPP